GTIFTAVLSSMVDQGNDGSGLLPMKGMVAITAGGEDGFGDQAAFHYLTSDLYLGTSVDAELDGQPNAQATGDDNTDTDDEDGVLLPSEFVAGTTKNFDVKVHLGSTSTAYLYGWMDFNLDGVFTPDEQILYGNAITAADLNAESIYSATVTIPIAAVEGTTIARFRLSTDADLSFSGAASDGEVEDYQVDIVHGTAVLAGWVFEDRDRDGAFDNSEIGIAGVIVYIDEYTDPMKLGNPQFDWDDLNGNGQFDPDIDRAYEPYVITMADDLTTPGIDETGYYIFDGLAGRPTAYQVRFDAPSLEDYQVIYPDGTVRFPDGSRGNDDHSYTMYLQEGEEFENVNFGSYPKPSVSVVDVTKYEGHEGFTDVQVTLRLVNSFGAPVEINYWTEDGSATIDNDDYVAKSGTITFDPQSIPAPTWDIHHLTSNASNDYDYGVSGNYVSWEGFDGNDWEIYLSNGTYDEGGVPYVIQLTNNDTDDRFASLYDTGASVNVVWVGTDGHDDEIYLYNGATDADGTPTVIRITSNAYDDHDPQVSDSLITWWADDGEGDNEIFVLDLAYVDNPRPHIINLTDNALDDRDPVLSGRNIVWTGLRGGTNTEIFVFDGENGDLANPEIVRVTSNSRVDQAPQIDGNQIVWEGQIGTSHEIFLYKIDSRSTTQVTTNSVEDRYPQISGNEVVWQSFTGSNWEILNYNTVAQSTPENISKNTYYDEVPQIAGNQVVWRAFTGWTWEVYHYDLQTDVLTNVSNSDGYDFNPQVSDVMVVWRANVDGNFEILAAERNEPEVLETITLRIIGDRDFEDDEYFYLNFEAVEIDTVRLESDRAVINILNDDGALDFGDAPSPYPTLLVDNGARHLVVAGVYLGSAIDAETNGKPNAEANGDDVSVTDDEDGVVIPASLAQGTTVGLTVTASTLGFLDAWMDFNADGDWDDEGERIFAGQMLTAGANTLNVNVPSTAKIGSSYARFRFSSSGGLGYTGQASSGEVEDYCVQFVAQPLVSNHVVTLSGTDGNDLFEFYAGSTLVVELNGSRMEFPAYNAGNPNSVHTILFDGGKGSDTVLFHGSTQSESVELWTNRGVFKGPEGTYGSPHNPYRYLVDTTNVEWIEAGAGGGNDAAVLHDSIADDVFTARPGYAEIKAATAVDAPLVAIGYNHVQAISSVGSDTANLEGTSGDDQFVGNPNTSELTNSDGTSFRADGFDNVIVAGQGHAAIGDKSWITGSANDDQFTSYPTQSVMSASDYRMELNAFRYVTAYAGAGGTDRANLFDSSGAETLTAKPEYVKLRNNSGAFEVTAYSFRYTATTATAGGSDVANFFDSPGADTFEATPTYAKLYGDTFYNRADYFRQVTADGHGGGDGADNDVVRLYDSTGNDIVIAGTNSMQLIGAGFQIRADYFQHLVAFASKGYDQARLYGTSGTDTFLGTTSYGKMTTLEESRSLRAYGFDKVQAWGLGGNDVAYLHDSPLGDLLETGTTAPDTEKAWAQLSNDDIDFLVWVTNFESVRAYSNSSGDRKDLDPNVTDFVLITEGTWEDL
ncbi:MAG: hypothetical protein JW719_12020, partial [Pirellulales bacterium]|nr:hypothetical protein [Pirellulales bacterium]